LDQIVLEPEPKLVDVGARAWNLGTGSAQNVKAFTKQPVVEKQKI